MKVFWGQEEKDKFLELFLKATKATIDSNNIIHFPKKGKNETDHMRPEDVEELRKYLKKEEKAE